MRRILLGGLGIALGAFAPPTFAQQPHGTGAPPARAAALGRPSAVPEPQPEPDITQTGLFRPGPARITALAPGNFVAPAPVISQPPSTGMPPIAAPVTGGMPVSGGMPVTGGMPQVSPTAAPGKQPSVIESRDPSARALGAATYVPSVAPGYDYPVCAEDPTFGCDPGTTALERVRSPRRGWVSAELLMWWNSGTTVPPLVTTSTPAFNGILGQGDTRVLLGGSFGDTFRVGGRVGAGYWFDCGECRGVDARLFWVAPNSQSFATSTAAFPLLARPFNNVNPGTAPIVPFGSASEVVAGPGVATGSVAATLRNTVWGAEVNYRQHLMGDSTARLDALAGYRYLNMSDQLTITEQFVRTPNSNMTVGVPAVSGVITDSFSTQNTFNGGQVGVAGTVQRGRWSLDSRATIAFGTVHQQIDIAGGQQLTFANGQVTTTQGGLLAVPGTNIGRFSQDKFAVLPEVGLNVGWQATERLKLYVGYNFLYLSSAVRAGDTIDPRVDAARVPNLLPPGTAAPAAFRPLPQFHTDGYFLTGINFGMSFRW